jgi:hypothetical protein
MKKIIALLLLVSISSCTLDELQDRTIVEGKNAAELSAPDSGSAYKLLPENMALQAERFVWTPANYNGNVEISYTLEMDVTGGDFSAPQILGGVNSKNQLSVSVEILNKACLALKVLPYKASSFDVRIVSSATGFDKLVSNVLPILITPYTTESPKLWMPGDYQGESGYGNDKTPSTAPQIAASAYGKTDFEGYVYFDVAGSFKFTGQPDWNPEVYGMGATDGTLDAKGGDIIVAASGYYLVKADTDPAKLNYSTTATSWGIIGDATAGGWGNSTPMIYDKVSRLWKITTTLTAAKFKFRANNGWDINLGDIKPKADKVNLQYGGDDIAVEAGNYTITLDLSVPRVYKYTITKN